MAVKVTVDPEVAEKDKNGETCQSLYESYSLF